MRIPLGRPYDGELICMGTFDLAQRQTPLDGDHVRQRSNCHFRILHCLVCGDAKTIRLKAVCIMVICRSGRDKCARQCPAPTRFRCFNLQISKACMWMVCTSPGTRVMQQTQCHEALVKWSARLAESLVQDRRASTSWNLRVRCTKGNCS